MNNLKPGDCIPMEKFSASFDDLTLDFGRLTKGRKYTFLLLGAGSPEQPLDANAALNALGWVYDPEAANAALAERKGAAK